MTTINQLLGALMDFYVKHNTTTITSEQATKLARLLAIQAENGATGLYLVVRYAPVKLNQMLLMLPKSNKSPLLLARAIARKTKDGKTGMNMLEEYAPRYIPAIFQLILKADEIKVYNYLPMYLVLISTDTTFFLRLFMKMFLETPNIATLNVLGSLAYKCKLKREFAVQVLQHAMNTLNRPEDIRELISNLEKNTRVFNHLFKRQGFTTLSTVGHCWRGKEVSHTWVSIINFAKQRIIDLQADMFGKVNSDDVAFLRQDTQKCYFFYVDYVQRYYDAIKCKQTKLAKEDLELTPCTKPSTYLLKMQLDATYNTIKPSPSSSI